MSSEQGRKTLEVVRGKTLAELSLTDFYWMVSEMDRLYGEVDRLEALRQQREMFRQKLGEPPSTPPPSKPPSSPPESSPTG